VGGKSKATTIFCKFVNRGHGINYTYLIYESKYLLKMLLINFGRNVESLPIWNPDKSLESLVVLVYKV
jgi:hypothetical protein